MKKDGITSLVDSEDMCEGAKKLRDYYAHKPNAPIYQQEFGFLCMDAWKERGEITGKEDLGAMFGFDPPGRHIVRGLGWCDAEFYPKFEEKFIENRGDHEVIQDTAGRHVLFFKNRRSGFMPEYLDHPVKDMKSWEEKCKWRLDPKNEQRYIDIRNNMPAAIEAAGKGMMMTQRLIGGYMFLRSLMGPVELLYMFYDAPELIHECMKTWLSLADAVVAEHQKHVTLDEIFLAEDICYNHGSLISHDMMNEFLIPYYQQLIKNTRERQIDKNRKLFVQIDTDGFSDDVLEVYMKGIGMNCLSPFEVASGCDVVRTSEQYPELIIYGGFDKRIIAAGKEAIDREIERIMPVMKQRGGYLPTCDHGVPEEVKFEDYLHFRQRMMEFGK